MSLRSLKTAAFVALATAAFAASASAQTTFTGKPRYQIEVRRADTIMGKIIVEMFPAIAPNSVENWDTLVATHFYDSLVFHRVVPKFVIQGGDPNSRSGDTSTWGYGDPSQPMIDAEFSAVSHRRGILSAARVKGKPNSATSQFFICVDSAKQLDRQYSVYGHVVQGMDVVDSIVKVPTYKNTQRPLDTMRMFITRIGSNDSLESVPMLVSPADGSSTAFAAKDTLKWQLVPGAMMYELQLATDTQFSNVVVDSTFNQIQNTYAASKLMPNATYYWRVLANNGGHASDFSTPWSFTVGGAGVANDEPAGLTLDFASPARADRPVTFEIQVPTSGLARLSIRDVLGREILRPVDGLLSGGSSKDVSIPAASIKPGIYFCTLSTSSSTILRRLIVQ